MDRMGGFKEYTSQQREMARANRVVEVVEEVVDRGEEYEWEGEEDEEEGDEFTMEFMLKMVGVEEGLIGWDRGLNNFRKA